MKISISVLVLLFFSVNLFAQADKDVEAVKSILMRQADDWNNGKIDDFMNGYWNSEKLQFIGATGVTYGWQKTMDNYKKNYPDKATMGKLTFGIVSTEKISKKVIMLVGTWELERAKDNPGGHFLLIWKKIKGNWVIIADHTSSK